MDFPARQYFEKGQKAPTLPHIKQELPMQLYIPAAFSVCSFLPLLHYKFYLFNGFALLSTKAVAKAVAITASNTAVGAAAPVATFPV